MSNFGVRKQTALIASFLVGLKLKRKFIDLKITFESFSLGEPALATLPALRLFETKNKFVSRFHCKSALGMFAKAGTKLRQL